MKKNLLQLLLLVVALVVSIGAKAQLADGEYYIKNVASGLYWGAGNNWGTRASLLEYSEYQKLTKQPDGTYTMETQVSNGGTSYFFGGDYMDGSPVNLTITQKGDYYTIANGDSYFGNSTEEGSIKGTYILGKGVDPESKDALWEIKAVADLTGATAANPIDLTYLLRNPNFGRNNRNGSAWTMEAGNKNMSGGTNENRCAESWRSTFTLSQQITVPRGIYTVTAQAALTDYAEKYDGANYPVVYANDVTEPFFNMLEADRGTNMGTLSNSFAAGNYVVTLKNVEVVDGKLTVGVKGTRTDTWCIWDNFQIKYCGPLDLNKLAESYNNALDKAQTLKDTQEPLSEATLGELADAISAYNNVNKEDENALIDAITALNEATAKANKSIAQYQEIKKAIEKAKNMFAGVDATSIEQKYNNGEFADDYDPNQIFTDFSQLAIAQTEAVAGADFTGAIINPSFSTGDKTGWTVEGKGSAWQSTNILNGTSLEYWTEKATNAAFDYHQSISGLPAGFYTISAMMHNSTNGEPNASFNTAGQVGVYIKDGTSELFAPVTVDGTVLNRYTTKPFFVNENSAITIGVKNNGTMTARWFVVDDFVLTYVNTVDGFIAQLKEALTEEEAQAQFEEAAKNVTTNNEMEAAFQAAIRTQTTEGADYTGAISNPSFETGNTAGWTFEASNDYGAKTYNMDGKDGNYLFNIWSSGNAISQTIENLPKGTYTLKAVAATDEGAKVLLQANGNSAEIEGTGADNGIEGELTFVVTDGKATIGAEGAEKHWYKVDKFRLLYAGTITEANSISELIATEGAVNFNMAALQVLNAGEDSIVVQDETGKVPAGILLKGTKDIAGADKAAYGKTISGQVYGTYDADNRVFIIEANSGNSITAANGEATVNSMELVDALKKDNAYLLTMIEMANIVEEEEGVFYAKKNDDKIKIDKRLAPSLMLYDGDAVLSITGVTFLEGEENVLAPMSQSDIRSNKAEAEDGAAYAQGETVNTVNGIIMTFGGSENTPDYEFAAVDPAVNKFGTKTEGIKQYPVDDNDKAYDPEQKNLPTKGTYYVFVPTKDGKLDITIDLEKNKKLYVTEDGEALKDFNGITTVKDNQISFPVEAMKTYYVFANESNLTYYGFTFALADAYAKNAVKDIATFKLLPQDNEEGDTLKLNNAVVTYIKGDNVFVEDASGAINIYKTGIQFYVGQQLNGNLVGQNHEENYMPQLLKTANTKYGDFKVTANITPEAKTISVAEATKKESLARFVKLEDLMCSKDRQGFKILLDEETGNSIRIEDHFNVFYELKNYVKSIEGIIAINSDSTFVFWPTSKEGVDTADGKETEMAIEDGKYLLKNVASGLYWGAGNNWGTRASLLDYSEYQTLAKQPDGTYTMETQVSNGGTNYFFGGDYMDGQPVSLTIAPVSVEGEEIVDFDASFYHNWSEVSGTATDNGSANGGVKLNEEVGAGGALWGNLSGAVPFKDYANITDYSELRFEGTPGAKIRLMCNRVVDEGPIFEIQPTIGEDGKLTVNISDLKFLNGGTPCDFVCLQSIKIPWGGSAAKLTSIQLVKSGAPKTYYTVANGDQYFGNSTEAGSNGGTYILGKGLSADDKNALWEIVPATADALAAATEKNPVDATFMILNPNFGRNNRNTEAWTMEAGNKNMSGGTNENRCAESWRSDFTLSQEIEVPNGVYALTAQAALTDYANLYDGNEYPVVYANEETAVFNNMQGSDIASNMNTLSNAFASGNYKVNTIYVKVTDGKLTIGAKGTRTDTWCIWDNFQLKYYGQNASIENLKGGAESKELDELRKKANDLMAEVEIATVKNALQNAINGTASVSGAEAIKAAIAILKEAVDLGEASKTAKNVLPKMKELVDATNVYTEEAYNEYYGTWLAKYEDGSLTKAEANGLQDPTVVTGWHAQITVDNFLLSAWDTNPDFNNAPYYINSWSVEGDSDGSDFHVPFFEYWTGDGDSLGEKTLTATMNGLEPGEYNVSAWVRVRMKNGAEAPAYGIDLQANDGTPVDVAAGAQIGDSQFFLDNFTATGTVGADGVLNIKFNVAADNNISWLSFKNVKFEKAGGDIADDGLIEIPQDQGKTLDDFARTDLVEGADYNTYTANADLQVAFKMYDIDVKDCDYVIVKFAEPVAAGWCIAFWAQGGTDNVAIPEGATEYKYVFADDPNCAIQNDILPQICMLTLWGAQKPLTAKVTGIYKHKVATMAHTWDFTKWSAETVANLKAEAAKVTVYADPDKEGNTMCTDNGALWSDHEKAEGKTCDTYTASKDNCFWSMDEESELTANGVAIAELKGLKFDASYAKTRSIAIAVNYPSTSLGTYNGPAYLWLGGKGKTCFTIPAVKGGTTIKIGVESHKSTDARGVQLFVGDTQLTDPDGNAVAAPKTYTEQTWQVPAGDAVDVVVKNTNGCHIYFIDATQDESVLNSINTVKNNFVQDGAIYNLRGQKVAGTLKPGLYIKNGKKFVIK